MLLRFDTKRFPRPSIASEFGPLSPFENRSRRSVVRRRILTVTVFAAWLATKRLPNASSPD